MRAQQYHAAAGIAHQFRENRGTAVIHHRNPSRIAECFQQVRDFFIFVQQAALELDYLERTIARFCIVSRRNVCVCRGVASGSGKGGARARGKFRVRNVASKQQPDSSACAPEQRGRP